MVTYTKPWRSLDEQLALLISRGVEVDDHGEALLRAVGYYRLTGYLYPFRESEPFEDNNGRWRVRVLDIYRAGTTLDQVKALIGFDRDLRMLVMDGIERVEVAVRMQLGYVLGRASAFAHEGQECFTDAFTTKGTDELGPTLSQQVQWLRRVNQQRAQSDENYVAHFREKHDNQMPIWALTELLELGQLSRLYRGTNDELGTKIAAAFGAPTKKVMGSWLASLNYVRNVSAHHARLFNRKLQHPPSRPKNIELLEHLRNDEHAKSVFGTYNALAVIAYLLRSVHDSAEWAQRVVALLQSFPTSHAVTIESMGVPPEWHLHELWQPATGS